MFHKVGNFNNRALKLICCWFFVNVTLIYMCRLYSYFKLRKYTFFNFETMFNWDFHFPGTDKEGSVSSDFLQPIC